MKTKILVLGLILFIFAYCKSPAGPDIEGALSPADIRVELVGSLFYYNSNVYFTIRFTEHDGVAAEPKMIDMLVYCDDTSHYDRLKFTYMCWRNTLKANGKLELDFDFYAGRYCYKIELDYRFLDENGHTIEGKKKFSVK